MIFEELSFANADAVWWLLAIPVIVLLKSFAELKSAYSVRRLIQSSRHRQRLVHQGSKWRYSVKFGLQIFGLACCILALTRPLLGTEEKEVMDSGRNVIFALDTSKSMLAQDLRPDRLTRAKLAAQDLLNQLPHERVGVIAFAGRAFLQAPLTLDHDAVRETMDSMDYTTIPKGGSSLNAAILMALETIQDRPSQHSCMVLFTDGQETDEATLEAAKLAKEKGLMIICIGVGTLQGAAIPDPELPQNYVMDSQGEVVISRLESTLLKEVSEISGGEFILLNDGAIVADLIHRVLNRLDRHDFARLQKVTQIERYQWPLAVGLLSWIIALMIPVKKQSLAPSLSMTKSMTKVGIWVLALLSFSDLQAGVDANIQAAREAFREQNYLSAEAHYKKALEKGAKRYLAEAEYGVGASRLQRGVEDRGLTHFSHALRIGDANLQLESAKALGQLLYEQGRDQLDRDAEDLKSVARLWEDSLSHLGYALQRKGDDAEIHANYDFVKKRLDELEQKMQQQQQNEQQGDSKSQDQKESGDSEGKGKGEKQDGKSGQESGEQENSSPRDSMKDDPQQVPEGDVNTGNQAAAQKSDDQAGSQTQSAEDQKRDPRTQYTPEEARSRLRSYADDRGTVQYLMRREAPINGKDY